MLREEKHVKLGLLEDESVPALGFFFLLIESKVSEK